MNLSLSDSQLKEVVAAAIVAQLTPENREKLIAEAIKNLISPDSSKFSGGTSPLQEAFKYAIQATARELIEKRLAEDDTVKTALNAIITDALKAVLTTNREKAVEKMADSLSTFLSGSRY